MYKKQIDNPIYPLLYLLYTSFINIDKIRIRVVYFILLSDPFHIFFFYTLLSDNKNYIQPLGPKERKKKKKKQTNHPSFLCILPVFYVFPWFTFHDSNSVDE